MTFDKNAQRARAHQFELEQLAKGVKAPVLPPIRPKPKVALPPPSAWPFAKQTVGQIVAEPATVAPPVHMIKRPKTNGVPKNNLQPTWTNAIGQLLCYNDRVLIVAQGYTHSGKTLVGTFLGAKIKNGRVTSVSCLVNDKVYKSGQGYKDVTVRRAYPSKRVYKLAL